MNMAVMWLVLAILLFVIEALTVGMVCIWFGMGAVVSMLCSFFVTSVYIQWIIFIAVSIITLVLLRPIAKKTVLSNFEKTNVSSFEGKTVFLTEDINEKSYGRLKIGDVSWLAISKNGEAISKGEKVKILNVKGNKLVVEKI